MILSVLLALCSISGATEPPFFLHGTQGQRDVGGLNQNDRALADGIRAKDLTNGGTVSGNLTISGTGNGVTFPDGTTQTTAAAGAVVNVSSDAYLTNDVNGSATHGPCIAGTTITITNPGTCKLKVEWNWPEIHNTANNDANIGFLVDGEFINTDALIVKGILFYGYLVGEGYRGTAGSYVSRSTHASGTRSLCATFSTSSGGQALCAVRGPCWYRFSSVCE